MIDKIKNLIDASENIVVLGHVNADGDSLCSAYALKDVLSSMHKKVVCLHEEKPGDKYAFLQGEYVVFSEDDKYEFDLAIAVDCGDESRLGSRTDVFKKALHTINIDHHRTNNNFAEVNIVKADYCAAAEVLAELFSKMKLDISHNAARLLYTGIMSDSGCLKFSNTTPSTLRIVADLMEYDFDHAEMTRMLFDNKSMELTKLSGYVMNNIESFEDGKITLISTDSEVLSKYNVQECDANDLINIPRSIAGSEIAIEVKERGGKIRVSLRSNGSAQVDRIAGAFGGGGHLKAAGATMEGMTLENAKVAVIAAAAEELKRCGI